MMNITIQKFKLILMVLLGCILFSLWKYAQHLGYEKGKKEIEQKYQNQAYEFSREISTILHNEFKKQQALLTKSQEINHEKLKTVLEEYKHLGDCHTANGIKLLNEHIKKQYPRSTIAK